MTKLLLCSALLAACTSATSTGITSSNLSCPSDSTLTYANFGSDFMSTNCLSCHATRDSPHLTTQATIQANASRILDQAVYSTAMPQGGDLSTEERQMLGEWLACGAP